MDTVDVLDRIDGFYRRLLVDMRGQWKLHQYAVEPPVPVELIQQLQDFRLGCIGGHLEGLTEHAHLGAGASLVADVDARGWVIAHQDGGQAGSDLLFLLHFQDTRRHLAPHFFGQCRPIQNLHHISTACLEISPASVDSQPSWCLHGFGATQSGGIPRQF